MKKILKLFSNCIPVKGAKRNIICDLQKNNFYFISDGLYEILTVHKDKELNEIKYLYNNKYDSEIDKYVSYMVENELAFFCSNPENFPDIEVKWDYPGHISNSIIEVDNNSSHDFKEIFSQLEKLGCKFLEVRFYNKTSLEKIKEVINYTDESKFRNIDLLIEFDFAIEIMLIEKMMIEYQRIGKIILHSVPESFISENKNTNIIFTKQIIKNNDCCGQVSIDYFTSNIEMYMESKLYNSCLNRKLSIDGLGDIKNCPSIKKSFGNIKETTLKHALEKQGFKDYWAINKDQIEVCKDCEFRYICTDCRAHIKDSNNIYSKPSKCTYNPYTAAWEDEKDNPSNKFKLQQEIN